MYNAHSYARDIERILKLPFGESYNITRNPIEYLKEFLDKEYEKSEEKAEQIDKFDEKYGKYKNKLLENWEEADTAQMVKDLRQIFLA